MKVFRTLRFVILGALAFAVITSLTAIAAANTVPATRVGRMSVSFYIDQLKPSACAGLSLTTLVTGSVILTGTSGNDLILASPSTDTIDGLGGDDCILGGGGGDIIIGGDGSDVCIGDGGIDTFLTCESQIQ